jgi:hypothetical protein
VYCEFCLAAYVGWTSRALPTYAYAGSRFFAHTNFLPNSSQFFVTNSVGLNANSLFLNLFYNATGSLVRFENNKNQALPLPLGE